MTTSLGTGGVGLGTVWGRETAVRMLQGAGFDDIDIKSVEGDPINVCYAATKR
jgi:hypothetical protein